MKPSIRGSTLHIELCVAKTNKKSFNFIKIITQTAVINFVFQRILLMQNLTLRMVVNIHFQKYLLQSFENCLAFMGSRWL